MREANKMAADDARTTNIDDETGMCTSGGVMIAVANHRTSVVFPDGGKLLVVMNVKAELRTSG